MNNQELKVHATEVRKNIVQMVTSAKSGHPGGSLSAADIITTLYFDEMNINECNVNSNKRDRFVLSKGHASPLIYGVLCEKGFIDKTILSTFRQVGSILQGHPNMNYVEGVDMSTGSLGQGLSAGIGMALANKLDQSEDRVYVLIGDGEAQEGQIWEAAMAAAHYKLDNLCAILDFNGLQIDGDITKVMNPTPFDAKFEAFGWNVIKINGHDFDEIKEAFKQARAHSGQPTLILATTIKGKGVSYMENQAGWHGVAPSSEQCVQAISELEGK